MRPLWLTLLLASLLLAGKDNFIFDLGTTSESRAQIAQLEQLQQQQQARLDHLTKQGNLHTAFQNEMRQEMAQLKRAQQQLLSRYEALSRADGAATPQAPQKGGPEGMDELKAQIHTLKRQVDRLSSDKGSDRYAELKQTLVLLDERLRSLEKPGLTPPKAQEPIAAPLKGGLVPLEPFYIDSFVFLTVGLMLMLFIMLMAALSRTKEAELKIAKLVEIYQSSTKKSEERK